MMQSAECRLFIYRLYATCVICGGQCSGDLPCHDDSDDHFPHLLAESAMGPGLAEAALRY